MSGEAPKQKIGQKHPTPTPGNGDRVFYETLYNQRPDSEMAQEWCVAYGVLSDEDAAKLHKKILKRKADAKSVGGSGGSSSSPAPKSEKKKSSSKKRGKKVMDDVEFDAGMGAGGDEGIGVGAL